MNRDQFVAKLQDMREHYHAAMNEALAGKSAEHAAAELIAGDETLLSLIEAAKRGESFIKTNIVGDTIGVRVKFLRESKGLTQWQLLALLGRPKSHQGWISRIEDDDAKFNPSDLKLIAQIFGVTIDELIP
jgi:ribosome-binding protein aMBF1 (putative translation factor)